MQVTTRHHNVGGAHESRLQRLPSDARRLGMWALAHRQRGLWTGSAHSKWQQLCRLSTTCSGLWRARLLVDATPSEPPFMSLFPGTLCNSQL